MLLCFSRLIPCLCGFSALMGVAAMPSALVAQESAAPLTDDQTAAIDSIMKVQLRGMVSFLASDEMKGRMTPSPELAIASRFVATQLQAAGLAPLSDDGSYFQVHSWPQIQLPSVDEMLIDGQSVKVLGVLAAGSSDAKIQGKLITEAEAIQAKDGEQQQCVLLNDLPLPPIGQVSPGMLQSFLSRRLMILNRKEVDLVIVKCDPDSQLPELAASLQGKSLSAAVGRTPSCPVILVSSDHAAVGKEIQVTIPEAVEDNAKVRNVFGVVKGSDPELSKNAIIVTAHLDHIGTRNYGPDKINNGADDNATGVAAVVAMAQAVARMKTPPKRSIIFGTFWGEESGLRGSRAYAQQPLWPLDRTTANVNLEMLGRPETNAEGKAWMTGWKHSSLGEVMNVGSQRVGVEIFNRTDVGEMLYARSDNYSFVEKGVIAHSFSAGSLHSDYHQPTDEWEKLNFDHMTTVTKGLMAGLLHLANRSPAPEKR